MLCSENTGKGGRCSHREKPRKIIEERVQNDTVYLTIGRILMSEGYGSGHEGYDMQEQRRIGDRTVRHLDVKDELVVQGNALAKCPKSVTDCEEHPEWAPSQGLLDSVSDGETSCQHQQQKITDPAVGQQKRSRLYVERKHGFDDYDANQRVGQRTLAPIQNSARIASPCFQGDP